MERDGDEKTEPRRAGRKNAIRLLEATHQVI